MKKDDRERCSWATTELYKEYHDKEWGKPVHDDRKLFEMLILEGMQAGLSWLTILNKRRAFREAFDEFDYQKVALYDEAKMDALMQNANIVRNRLKIKSAIINARQFIKVQEEYGSFDAFIWSYVEGRPIHNHFKSETDIPATTPLSDKISKDLKKCGFKFVGSTIVYAYMQAIGIPSCSLGEGRGDTKRSLRTLLDVKEIAFHIVTGGINNVNDRCFWNMLKKQLQ